MPQNASLILWQNDIYRILLKKTIFFGQFLFTKGVIGNRYRDKAVGHDLPAKVSLFLFPVTVLLK